MFLFVYLLNENISQLELKKHVVIIFYDKKTIFSFNHVVQT